MLELVDVRKSYPVCDDKDGQSVLCGIDLTVNAKETLAILGPSGCGKSTLLNIMGALDKADQGQVTFEGNDLSKADDLTLAHIRNSRIGFIFQQHHLLPQLTVLENVLLPTLADKKNAGTKQYRAEELLQRVGLSDFSARHPAQLSGGQRQRVAVVRALINSPVLLLADEPTGSLDADASENIAELLLEVNKTEEAALVVVTHSTKLAAKMSRSLVLDNGILTEAGANV
jgi:ABC-type lipoprotein export system ATPase subunit